jgi:hypothetical protein
MKKILLFFTTAITVGNCFSTANAQHHHQGGIGRLPGSFAAVRSDATIRAQAETSASDWVGLQFDESLPTVVGDPYATAATSAPSVAGQSGSILDDSVEFLPNGTHFSPLLWSSCGQNSRPMLNYMLQQWCVDGLWDSHPAERAAQCAKQAYRVSGGWRHAWHHCTGGCASGSKPICSSCENCQTPRNRYLQPNNSAAQCSCD